jgi:hypothetical protein
MANVIPILLQVSCFTHTGGWFPRVMLRAIIKPFNEVLLEISGTPCNSTVVQDPFKLEIFVAIIFTNNGIWGLQPPIASEGSKEGHVENIMSFFHRVRQDQLIGTFADNSGDRKWSYPLWHEFWCAAFVSCTSQFDIFST